MNLGKDIDRVNALVDQRMREHRAMRAALERICAGTACVGDCRQIALDALQRVAVPAVGDGAERRDG